VASLDRPVYNMIRQLSSTGVFKANQVSQHLLRSFNIIVDTKLIGNIGYRQRSKIFGDRSDTSYLLEQQQNRRDQDDTYELVYAEDGSLRNVVYIHLVKPVCNVYTNILTIHHCATATYIGRSIQCIHHYTNHTPLCEAMYCLRNSCIGLSIQCIHRCTNHTPLCQCPPLCQCLHH
jgi:hypothetical protein